jgi:GT2 family glycosyltransferase
MTFTAHDEDTVVARSNIPSDPRRWAAVIPSFSHADDAIACVRSLWDAEPRPARVLLVDDASPDDSAARIASWARNRAIPEETISSSQLGTGLPRSAWLTIVKCRVNSGFTTASNTGIRAVFSHTDAPYVLLLNNDAAVAPSFFAELAHAVDRFPEAGLLTGTIYEWDGESIWYAGGRVNPFRALAQHELRRPVDDTPTETQFISGCAMLISRALTEAIGVLAACFEPCYSEDVDYSLRARAAGFPVVYTPRAAVYHRVGSTFGRSQQSPSVTFYVQRNRAFVIRRNFRGWRRAAGVTYLGVTKPVRALVEIAKGRPRTGWAILRGTFTGLLSAAARGANARPEAT